MVYSDWIDSNHSDANFQRQTQTVAELFRVFAIYIEIPALFISRIWHLFRVFGYSSNFWSLFFPEIGIYSKFLVFILSFWCHFLRLIPFNPSFWMQLFREIGYPAKFRSYLFPEFGFNPSFWYLFRVSGCYFFQKLALQRISGYIYSQKLVLHQAHKAKISI